MHGAAAIRAVLLLVVCLGRRDGHGGGGKGRQAEAILGAWKQLIQHHNDSRIRFSHAIFPKSIVY